ncbi:MAG: carboxypeptidase regulatory-like domain-containing protein [Muribaculaceae bacterium]|nr:carboxypeptidase regulatory-like domain-containing protein [Muribaculaceae bacterium]
MGRFYDNGIGVDQDRTESAIWYRRSAEQGDALAQYYLACAYEEGDGVPQDLEEAVNWYKKAEDNGEWFAQDWVKNYEASRKSLIQVTGRVFDEDGIAVVNATLTIVRPQNYQSGNASELPEVTTDFDGRFTLDDVPDGSILNVSYTDYKPASVKVTSKNCKDLKITLNNK